MSRAVVCGVCGGAGAVNSACWGRGSEKRKKIGSEVKHGGFRPSRWDGLHCKDFVLGQN